MAYRPRLAAALSGASLRQLAYWRRGSVSRDPILVPEVSARPVLYSFRDVVALRTFVYLRSERISLQRIRRALDTLQDIGRVEHLSNYRLVAEGRSVVLVPEGDASPIDLVEHPGHHVTVVMSDVLRSFDVDERLTVPDLIRPRNYIAVDPEVRGGHPVVLGTRVPFDLVAGLVRDGVAYDEIAEYYPQVGALAAQDATDLADYVDRYGRRADSAA
ncbi:DUF433 domain-containing protein [Kribbella sp. NPDC002412]